MNYQTWRIINLTRSVIIVYVFDGSFIMFAHEDRGLVYPFTMQFEASELRFYVVMLIYRCRHTCWYNKRPQLSSLFLVQDAITFSEKDWNWSVICWPSTTSAQPILPGICAVERKDSALFVLPPMRTELGWPQYDIARECDLVIGLREVLDKAKTSVSCKAFE